MRSIILAACLTALLAAPLHARRPGQPFKTLTGGFFAVSVADLPASVQWYSEKLGLAVVMEVRQGIDVAVLEGGGLIVELIRDPAAHPDFMRAELTHGFFKTGFVVRDFEKTIEELAARGVPIAFGPYPAREGQKANLLIRDNSGNLIQILGE